MNTLIEVENQKVYYHEGEERLRGDGDRERRLGDLDRERVFSR